MNGFIVINKCDSHDLAKATPTAEGAFGTVCVCVCAVIFECGGNMQVLNSVMEPSRPAVGLRNKYASPDKNLPLL